MEGSQTTVTQTSVTSISSVPLAEIYGNNQSGERDSSQSCKGKGEVLPGIYYGIDKGKEYSKCFNFNFLLVDKEGIMPIESPMAGGAPGIAVDKESGQASVISFGQLAKLS